MKDNYGQSIQRSLGSILRVALAVLVCLTLGALSGTGSQASAQNRSASKTVKIKGSVIDEDSKPVPGVAVLVKGHPEFGGTMTDEKGGFVFNVPSDATVQFSCIGYKPVEMSVARNLDWLITMVHIQPLQQGRGSRSEGAGNSLSQESFHDVGEPPFLAVSDSGCEEQRVGREKVHPWSLLRHIQRKRYRLAFLPDD